MSLISKEQKDYVLDRIENIPDIDDLNALKDDILEVIERRIEQATDKLEQLSPQLALLDIPTTPDKLISWVSDFINNFLKPALSPAIQLGVDIAETVSDVTEIKSAIDEKIGLLSVVEND